MKKFIMLSLLFAAQVASADPDTCSNSKPCSGEPIVSATLPSNGVRYKACQLVSIVNGEAIARIDGDFTVAQDIVVTSTTESESGLKKKTAHFLDKGTFSVLDIKEERSSNGEHLDYTLISLFDHRDKNVSSLDLKCEP